MMAASMKYLILNAENSERCFAFVPKLNPTISANPDKAFVPWHLQHVDY